MDHGERPVPRPPGRWDPLLDELISLRVRAGELSYAEIGRRVVERRLAQGAEPHAARIARSSVHDAFRLGRSRINVPLTREIVRALDADPGVVDGWVRMCAQPAPEPAPAPAQRSAESVSGARLAAVLAACVLVNLLGRVFVDQLHLPIYLDMVGTAIAAVSLGPWRGAAVGLATNVLGVWPSGAISLDFAVVNVVGGLLWGFGIRSWGLGRTLPRYFALNLGVGVACSALSVPILLWNFGYADPLGQGVLTETLLQSVHSFVVAETGANLMASAADKLLSGFVALVVVSAAPAIGRSRPDLPIVVPD